MFTGIIKKTGRIEKIRFHNGSLFLDVQKPRGWKIKLGESVSLNGICSTIAAIGSASFRVEYMPETIKKTAAKNYNKGVRLNLEKSLRFSDPVDGHLVQGHIDTVGIIAEIKKEGRSILLKIKVPASAMKLVAPKGAISVDGISLTVVNAGKDWLTVSLINYTIKNTNLKLAKPGQAVNIETDMFAKYIYNMLKNKKFQ